MRSTSFHAAVLILSAMVCCSPSSAQGRGRGAHGRAPNANAAQGQAHAENAGHGNGQGAAYGNAGEGQNQAAAHRPALPPQAQAHAGAGSGSGEGATASGSSAHGPAQRPAGWDRGNKTGWGDCNVPPGLEASSGCGASLADIARAERAKHASSATNHGRSSSSGTIAATPVKSEVQPPNGSASQSSPKKDKEPNANPDRD